MEAGSGLARSLRKLLAVRVEVTTCCLPWRIHFALLTGHGVFLCKTLEFTRRVH